MTRLRSMAAMALVTIAAAVPVEGQTPPGQATTNDARAQLARFQPPPPPASPAPLPQSANQPTNQATNQAANNDQPATSGQPRRLWRDMLDSLLDLMAPRALTTARLLDDPLTTGFGNSDFVEPLRNFYPAALDSGAMAGKPR